MGKQLIVWKGSGCAYPFIDHPGSKLTKRNTTRTTGRVACSQLPSLTHPLRISRIRKQEPAYGDVLIELRPVNPNPTTNEPQVLTLLWRRLSQPRKPVDRHFDVKPFLTETFVSVVRRDHPMSRRKISLSRFAALDHVLVITGCGQVSSVDRKLEAHGLSRRVALRVPSFWAALHAVRDSDAVTTLPKRFVDIAGTDVSVLRLADQIPGFSLSLVWHPRNTTSPRHRFVREALLGWAG